MGLQHPRTIRPGRESLHPYLVWLDSWNLVLESVSRSQRTRTGYLDDIVFLAAWMRRYRPKFRDWEDVDKAAMIEFFAWLQRPGTPCPHLLVDRDPAPRCTGYAVGYVRHVAVSASQFLRWWAEEEDLPNPLDRVELPAQQQLGKSLIPVIEKEDLQAIIGAAEKNRDFASRRDAAILRLIASTGVRLAELAGLRLGDVRVDRKEAVVTGKGNKIRIVRFDTKTALAVDRYLRTRAKQKGIAHDASAPLWVGRVKAGGDGAMTGSGIYQAIKRRARALGLTVHPHMFRHTFTHRWLDAGGAEGDLMELNGWDSPQMLRHYGASARQARARRAYDRIDVMGGI